MTTKKVIRCFVGMLWYGFAGIVVSAAVLLTLARLLLPLAEDYRTDAEQALSEYAGQPVKVVDLKAEWSGFEPQLHFSNVRLYDKQGEKVLFQFADAKMGIDVFSSIKNYDLVPSSFTISGIKLSITRNADKSFSIDGLSDNTNTSSKDSSRFLVQWLLRQPDIGIESSTIMWTDIPLNEKNILFQHVDLRLKNDADIHQLTGHVVLPEKLGKEINIALELRGDSEDVLDWQGDIYIKATELQAASWWKQPISDNVEIKNALTNIELWGKWKNRSLIMLEGNVSFSDLMFDGKRSKEIPLQSLTAKVLWQKDDKGWSFLLRDFLPVVQQGAWPASNVTLRYEYDSERFAALVDYMQLSDVLPTLDVLGLISEKRIVKVFSIKPHATLTNTSVLISNDGQWHVDGRFSNLSVHTSETTPGVTGLTGSFVVNEQQGSLQIDSNKVVLDTVGFFREPVELLKLTGSMQWQKDDAGWMIEAADFDIINEDITLRASMTLSIPNNGSPVIDLLANFENANAVNTQKYLPVNFLDTKTIAWLDSAIIQGTSPSGGVVLRGPLDKFPFDNGEGKFETRFSIINGKLDYEPGWPLISDMQGEVIFSGRSLDIIGRTGRILDANVHEVTAHIDDIDLDNPLLELKGHVDATTQDLIKYVIAAKLAEGYSKELKELDSDGKASLRLDIKIPMATGDGVVKGIATLKNASLGLKGKNIRLDKINGKVEISNDGLAGDEVKGRLFKTPVKIQLSNKDDAATEFAMKLKGLFDLNELVKTNFREDIPIISLGKTNWLAGLSFKRTETGSRFVVLELESDLENVNIDLPEPIGKDKQAIVPLRISATIKDEEDLEIEIDYGDDVSAVVALNTKGDDIEYEGSSIAFGDALPLQPSFKRLSIVGQLDALSLDSWLNYASHIPKAKEESASSSSLAWLESVDIRVDALRAMGTSFNVKNLKLTRDDTRWVSFINADRAKGEIFIPFNLSSLPIRANLEFLKVAHIENEDGDSNRNINVDPRDLPGLALSVDQFTYDGIELGSLNTSVSKKSNGLSMDKFAVVGDDLQFTANASWQVENDEQITRFNAKLKSQRFSGLLTDLGYSVGFEADKSRNLASVHWNGSPFQFAVEKLNGTLKIKIYKGQLLDVSPGAGRIFGLLSLQALPRRLTLDFSDLFKKGFSFDKIKGNFQLDEGNAYTTDLYLDGPAARLDVSGRTGLAARDYDQLITVTPDLTGSLPLAGALVGGPIAGGVMFALDKLLRPAIDDITRYQYTVSGSWDDPQVVKLEEAEQETAKSDEP